MHKEKLYAIDFQNNYLESEFYKDSWRCSNPGMFQTMVSTKDVIEQQHFTQL